MLFRSFGESLLQRLDQAFGRIDEPITPRLPVPDAMAEQRFHEPIAREAESLRRIAHGLQCRCVDRNALGEAPRARWPVKRDSASKW